MTRPQLLLLDEAASGLDSAAAMDLMTILRALAEGSSWLNKAVSFDEADPAYHECRVRSASCPGSINKHQQAESFIGDFANNHSACSTPKSCEEALSSMAVIMSVHQPSGQLLNSFDKIMILSDGCVVYYGSPSHLGVYATNMQMKCVAACTCLTESWQKPFTTEDSSTYCPEINPIDYVIEILSSKTSWVSAVDTNNWETAKLALSIEGSILDISYEEALWFVHWPRHTLAHFYDSSTFENEYLEYCAMHRQVCDEEMGCKKNAQQTEISTGHLPYCIQFCILLRRSFILTNRSSWMTVSSFVETGLIGFIAGLCWWNTLLTEKFVIDITAYLSFSTTYWFFSSLYVGLIDFFPERVVLQKERDSGNFQLSAYFMSKCLANFPIRVSLPVIYTSISYPMAFQDQEVNVQSAVIFLAVIGIIILASQSGESIGQFIGATVKSIEVGTTVSTTVSLSMLIFGGFYKQNIPYFLDWLRKLSVLNYSFDASVQIVIGSQELIACDSGNYIPACYSQSSISSAYVLNWLQVTSFSVAVNATLLVIIVICLRFIAYLSLRFILHRPARGYY